MSPLEPPSQVHIAAAEMRVGSVVRQRCSWCGALLEEWDLSRMAREIPPGEDPDAPWTPPMWKPGALVRLSGTFPRCSETVEPEIDDDGLPLLPEDACGSLDGAVTA